MIGIISKDERRAYRRGDVVGIAGAVNYVYGLSAVIRILAQRFDRMFGKIHKIQLRKDAE